MRSKKSIQDAIDVLDSVKKPESLSMSDLAAGVSIGLNWALGDNNGVSDLLDSIIAVQQAQQQQQRQQHKPVEDELISYGFLLWLMVNADLIWNPHAPAIWINTGIALYETDKALSAAETSAIH